MKIGTGEPTSSERESGVTPCDFTPFQYPTEVAKALQYRQKNFKPVASVTLRHSSAVREVGVRMLPGQALFHPTYNPCVVKRGQPLSLRVSLLLLRYRYRSLLPVGAATLKVMVNQVLGLRWYTIAPGS